MKKPLLAAGKGFIGLHLKDRRATVLAGEF
jgi:hypothetical protein